jgi:uncharacterized membrane protein
MALRTEQEVRAELEEIDQLIREAEREVARLRRLRKGISEAYEIDMKPRKSWTRKSKELVEEKGEGEPNE